MSIIKEVVTRIRQVSSNGIITTVAGNNLASVAVTSPATAGILYFPSGLGVGSTGDLFISDTYMTVRKVFQIEPFRTRICRVDIVLHCQVSSGGAMMLVAGVPGVAGSIVAGPATNARLNQPRSVVMSPIGDIFILENNNCVVSKVGDF